MKIGILSDTHDNMAALEKAVAAFNDAEVALVIHAGDMIAPVMSRSIEKLQSEFIAVFGNCDGERIGLSKVFPDKIFVPPHTIVFKEKRILVFHEPSNIDILADSDRFDAIVYGHTHTADIRKHKNTWIINPGECSGLVHGKRTAAVWDCDADEVNIFPL